MDQRALLSKFHNFMAAQRMKTLFPFTVSRKCCFSAFFFLFFFEQNPATFPLFHKMENIWSVHL